MHKGKTVLGIITARGGSKSIPHKNIREICGHPLIAYTIKAAKKSRKLDRCIVSTESKEIAAIARSQGADVPFLRPKNLATDEARTLAVVQHAIRWLREHEGTTYDYVMILQPTSPLRTAADIDACIDLAMKRNADSVFSMKKIPDCAPQKLKTIKDGRIKPLFTEEGKASRPRHEGLDIYKRNCAVYLTRTALIVQGDMFGKRSFAYVMPEERSLDINEPVDLELATFWMQKLHLHDI